ncbi:MAG: ABC transporter substrate-binding protein [Chloroflexi bacterium]|nr:ABC transporter substrate-binding protein [Chloroflexota bacterium]
MNKGWLLALVSVSSLIALPACAAPAATPTKAPTATPTKRPLTKVTSVTSSNTLIDMPALIARAKGFWPEEGLDVDWVVTGSGSKALAAMVGGSADFSFQSFTPEVVKVIDSGQKIKVVAIFQQRGVEILALNKKIAAERGVSQKSSLADKAKALKGLTLATFSPGGSTYQLLKVVLAEGGLDPERDVTVTFIGDIGAVVAAMSQGQIQGFSHTTDTAAQSVVAGDAMILVSTPDGDLPIRGNMALYGMAAQERTISERAEVTTGALRAIWRGQRLFHEDFAGAAKALKTLEFFAEVNEDAFNMTMQLLRGSVPKEPLITTEQFNDMVKFHNATVKAEEQTKMIVNQFFDDGPGLRAKKELGF